MVGGLTFVGSPEVLLDEGAVYVDQDPLLPLGDRCIGEHSHLHRSCRMVRRIEDPGSDVERFCGDAQRFGKLLQHLCRRLAKASLDLTEVRIGYPGLVGELTQRQLCRSPLTGNELTERTELIRDLVRSDSCHAASVLAIASTLKLLACRPLLVLIDAG